MSSEVDELVGAGRLGDAPLRLRREVRPDRVVIGWATVELDRAEAEVTTGLAGDGVPRVEPARDERVLGARCRLLRFAARDVLLLEPSTEGRLAAALARHGEGPLVLYLVADSGATERARRAGFTLTSAGEGPLGTERLVIAGPRDGPFLVLAGLE